MDSSRGHCYSRGYRHLRLGWAVFSGAPCNLWVGYKLVDKLLAAHLADDILRSEEQGGRRVLRAVSFLRMSFFPLAPISLISFRLVDSSSLSMSLPSFNSFSGPPQQFFSVLPIHFPVSLLLSLIFIHLTPLSLLLHFTRDLLTEQVRTKDLGITDSGMLTGLFWKLATAIGK